MGMGSSASRLLLQNRGPGYLCLSRNLLNTCLEHMSLQEAGIAFDSSDARKLLQPSQMYICLLQDGKYAMEGAFLSLIRFHMLWPLVNRPP